MNWGSHISILFSPVIPVSPVVCLSLHAIANCNKLEYGTDGKDGTNGEILALFPFVPSFPSVPYSPACSINRTCKPVWPTGTPCRGSSPRRHTYPRCLARPIPQSSSHPPA